MKLTRFKMCVKLMIKTMIHFINEHTIYNIPYVCRFIRTPGVPFD